MYEKDEGKKTCRSLSDHNINPSLQTHTSNRSWIHGDVARACRGWLSSPSRLLLLGRWKTLFKRSGGGTWKVLWRNNERLFPLAHKCFISFSPSNSSAARKKSFPSKSLFVNIFRSLLFFCGAAAMEMFYLWLSRVFSLARLFAIKWNNSSCARVENLLQQFFLCCELSLFMVSSAMRFPTDLQVWFLYILRQSYNQKKRRDKATPFHLFACNSTTEL